MSGIAGWISRATPHDSEQLFALFREVVTGNTNQAMRTWRAANAGLALAAMADAPMSAAMHGEGASCVVLFGRPRWVGDGRPVSAIDQVCRRFLEAYRSRNGHALESLQGDFAVVAMDADASEVLLAVDRIGIRNLIYQSDELGIVFGSDCDIVRRHPDTSGEIDLQAVYDYTYFHVVPSPGTIYRKQHRLLPGHCLTWARGETRVCPYWEMKFTEQAGGVADFKPQFRKILRDAVEDAAAGARCGSFLSGGTDSSTVAGTLGEVTGRQAQTYSIGFAVEGYDEMDYARIAVRHFGTQQHEYYVTPEDVVDALPKIAAAYDQPFGNSSAVAAYYCAKLARSNGIERLLAGDGGDEIFGGNSRYAKQYQLAYYDQVPALLRKAVEPVLLPFEVFKHVPLLRKLRSYIEQASRPMPARYDSYNLIDRLGPENLFTPEFFAQVDRLSPIRLLQETYANYRDASLINQMLGIDLKFTLADSDLPKVTRMCELAGVAVAFPLLDESLVTFSATLPSRLKLNGTKLRFFFKEALRDFLPAEILRKQKHGFGLPVGSWLTTHPQLKALAGDSLLSLKGRGIIAPAFVDTLLNEHLRTHAAYFGTMVWVLMMLELWFQKHLAGYGKP